MSLSTETTTAHQQQKQKNLSFEYDTLGDHFFDEVQLIGSDYQDFKNYLTFNDNDIDIEMTAFGMMVRKLGKMCVNMGQILKWHDGVKEDLEEILKKKNLSIPSSHTLELFFKKDLLKNINLFAEAQIMKRTQPSKQEMDLLKNIRLWQEAQRKKQAEQSEQ